MLLNYTKLVSKIRESSKHVIYVRLVLLLLCIALTVTLMQAGSMFLLDYIPSRQSTIGKINVQKIYWVSQLAVVEVSQIPDAKNRLISMREHFINDLDTNKRFRSLDSVDALDNVDKAQTKFEAAIRDQKSLASLIRHAKAVISSYERLDSAIHDDIEEKQSITALLQLMGLIFIMICIATVALEGQKLLITRLGNLNKFMLDKLNRANPKFTTDEFSYLEQSVYELTARLEGYVTESSWASNTSDHVRALINAQEFLFKFVQMANDNTLSERTLLKMIYSLERAMKFNNVAVIYTDDAAVISTERVIYSDHSPIALRKEVYDELEISGMAKYHEQNANDVEVCCLGVIFSGSSAAMGILLVEMDSERFLEDSEIKVLDITAKLLTMVTRFQSNDEEGRRIAILEERAAIGRELHDSLAQSLSYMKIQLARLQSKVGNLTDDNGDKVDLSDLREGLDHAYRGLRELLSTFRAHMDLRGLGYAIQSAIDEFSQRSDLTITLDNRLVNCRLTVNEEFHILQVIREALSNIVRHSGANKVTILMLLKQNYSVEITIDDNGSGFIPADDKYDHHGQAIMKERAYNLGGTIEVMAIRHGGTRVKLTFMPKLAQ
jgi:two-component system nitrate/nitrite sensor histidine kinase NarX